jgi:hypothetical protein
MDTQYFSRYTLNCERPGEGARARQGVSSKAVVGPGVWSVRALLGHATSARR